MARVGVPGLDLLDQRRALVALREAIDAARCEPAAGRRREERRGLAGDDGPSRAWRLADPGDRVEQRPGVRVLRLAEDGPLRAFPDEAARVHDDDALGET